MTTNTMMPLNSLLMLAVFSSFTSTTITTTAFTISSENNMSPRQKSRQLISRFGTAPSNMICEDGVCRRVNAAESITKSRNSNDLFPIFDDEYDMLPPLFAEEAAALSEVITKAKEESDASSSSSSSSSIIDELNDSNFEQILHGKGGDEIANSDTPVLVDCYATWCGPCKKLEPTLDRCAKQRESTLRVVKYDIQSRNINIKMELLEQGIMINRLPLLVLFHNGEVVAKINGAVSDEQLNDFLNNNIQQQPKKAIEVECIPEHTAGFLNLNSSQQKDDYMLGLYDV